jgi:hypothetical protein
VAAPAAALKPTGAALAEARERLQQIRSDGGPLARYAEQDAERAAAVSEASDAAARAEHRAAIDAHHEELRRAFFAKKKPLVARLDAALAEAAAANARLGEIEVQEREAVGNHTAEWWSWAELMQSTAQIESRLDLWRRGAWAYGLLDEK